MCEERQIERRERGGVRERSRRTPSLPLPTPPPPAGRAVSLRHLGYRVQGSGFRVQGSGFRVQGSGFRVQGAGCRVQGSGFRVQGAGRRVKGFHGISGTTRKWIILRPSGRKRERDREHADVNVLRRLRLCRVQNLVQGLGVQRLRFMVLG